MNNSAGFPFIMQQQTAAFQTAEKSSTQTVEAETDSFVDCIHTGYSECSLDASADLRNETSCKENRKYILISITIRASNILSRSDTRKGKPTLSILLELRLFAAKAMFWFCVNQSDYGKSYTQFWL